MKTSIFQTLKKLGLTSKQSRVLFNERTRDVDNLKVWRDSNSGVIYIDDFYTNTEEYVRGIFRDDFAKKYNTSSADFERHVNNERRFISFLQYVAKKRVADFGCGKGFFLRKIQPYCKRVIGVELEQNYVSDLNANGVECLNTLTQIDDDSLDIVVSFHVIEHLPNPLEIFSEMIRKVVSGGQILIEVPHANDFLLSTLNCEDYKQFTLWSQHLVLHTRESLRKILNFVGLEEIKIEGVQRYPLSNHLNWLANGKAGGHKSSLSSLDSDALCNAYQNALARVDATDTLVAIAKVP
jgi:SAM-dependent methyltransferase